MSSTTSVNAALGQISSIRTILKEIEGLSPPEKTRQELPPKFHSTVEQISRVYSVLDIAATVVQRPKIKKSEIEALIPLLEQSKEYVASIRTHFNNTLALIGDRPVEYTTEEELLAHARKILRERGNDISFEDLRAEVHLARAQLDLNKAKTRLECSMAQRDMKRFIENMEQLMSTKLFQDDKMLENMKEAVVQVAFGDRLENGTAGLLDFSFGTEMEVQLRPAEKCQNWTEVVEILSGALFSQIVPNLVHDESSKPSAYKKWLITRDGSVRGDRNTNLWGMELVSPTNWWPFFDFGQYHRLWNCIDNYFQVLASASCGTHVHVSLYPNWKFFGVTLKRIAKAVVYFERCVDSFMPSHRMGNRYCLSNRHNPVLEKYDDMQSIFQEIDKQESMTALANLMCADGQGSHSRKFRWNFTRLGKSGVTIEFRQAPGSTSAKDAISWTEFVISFVQGANDWVDVSPLIDPTHEAELLTLYQMVWHGYTRHELKETCSPMWLFFSNKQLPEEQVALDEPQPQSQSQPQPQEVELEQQQQQQPPNQQRQQLADLKAAREEEFLKNFNFSDWDEQTEEEEEEKEEEDDDGDDDEEEDEEEELEDNRTAESIEQDPKIGDPRT